MPEVHENYISLTILTVIVVVGLLLAQAEGFTVYIIGITFLCCIAGCMFFLMIILSTSIYINSKNVYNMNPGDYLGKSMNGSNPKEKRTYKNMGISY